MTEPAQKGEPDPRRQLAFLIQRQKSGCDIEDAAALNPFALPVGTRNHLFKGRGDELVFVVEIMSEAARSCASLPGNVHKAHGVEPPCPNDFDGSLGKRLAPFSVVDLFWHNGDYIKNDRRYKT